MKRITTLAIIFIVVTGSFGVFGNKIKNNETQNKSNIYEDDCGCGTYFTDNKIINSDSNTYKYALGWMEEDLEQIPKSPDLLGTPPPSWDWRNVNGENWLTPIRDQGYCGSCWAFGAVAAMEAIYNIKNNNPDLDVDLSEQYLVSCGMKYSPLGLNGCCGGTMSYTLDFLNTRGTVEESSFSYQAVDALGRDFKDCNTSTPSNDPVKCPSLDDPKYKIDKYHSLPTKNSIKNAIASYGPVVAGFNIYADFYEYNEGIYERNSNKYIGGHIVAIVGYNDAGQYWICKNSWGTDFGEDGYFRIKYGECGIDSPFHCSYFKSCSISKNREIFYFMNILEQFPLLKNLFQSIFFYL